MRPYFILLIFGIVLLFAACEKDCEIFTGTVVSNSKSPISDAVISVNGKEVKSNKRGEFAIAVRKGQKKYLVSVRKFGFGLYSRKSTQGFVNKEIVLSKGTILKFDPSKDNVLTDTMSTKNPFPPSLLGIDTGKLFKMVPKVYDHTGKLIDLGYPEEVKHVFDYLKLPLTGGPGISVSIPANSLVNNVGNPPPSGAILQASLTTIDFFNPDGMPGDFIVSTEEGLAYMESFGAGNIDISDGKNAYQLKKGSKVKVTFPVYPVRLQLKENLPDNMPLLHFDEKEGVWKQTGMGTLNEARNAYIADVQHFSVLNMDIIKTGDSKCFKVRQMLKFGAADNSANYLDEYRAQIIVPPTSVSTFREYDYLIDETTGCVPVPVGVNATSLHGITRIPDTYIAVVFSHPTLTDTLDIVISQPASTSIPAQTAVASAGDCSTACDPTTCTGGDPLDAGAATPSTCNSTCWMPDCAFIPFENTGPQIKIVGVAIGGNKVKVKWLNTNPDYLGSLQITAHATANCTGAATEVLVDKCTGCGPNECVSGEAEFSGTGGTTVSFKLQVFDNATLNCTGIPIEVCTGAVVVLN